MRIMLISEGYPPAIGGLEKAVGELARHLADRGHDVLVVTLAAGRSYSCAREGGVKVYRLPRFPHALLVLSAMIRLFRILRRERPDIVNLHYIGYLAFAFHLVNRLLNVRYIASIHGADIEKRDDRFLRAKTFLVRRILTRARRVLSNSGALLAGAERLAGEPIRDKSEVVGNGIDLAIRPERPDRDSDIIVGVGRFVRKKGFDVLIRAFGELAKEAERDYKLLLAGDGPELPACRALCRTLGIERSVAFLGYVRDVRDLLDKAALFVLPSRHEPFGIVLLEAMAAGAPIVATNTGGVPEIIEHGRNGLLVPADDPMEMAVAMRTVLRDDGLAARLRSGGMEGVRRYDWRVVLEKYESVYRSAADGDGGKLAELSRG